MAKGKGLSLEEKRKRMLSLFVDNPTFYHFKEIEKISLKKGITFQSIKDVLISLVGDNLIESDKIGASIYYWALPSKAYQMLSNQLNKNNEEISKIENEIIALANVIEEIKLKSEATPERKEQLDKLHKLNEQYAVLHDKIQLLEKNDAQKYYKMKEDLKKLLHLIDTYTDNIYAGESFLKTKVDSLKMIEIFPECEGLGLFDEDVESSG